MKKRDGGAVETLVPTLEDDASGPTSGAAARIAGVGSITQSSKEVLLPHNVSTTPLCFFRLVATLLKRHKKLKQQLGGK